MFEELNRLIGEATLHPVFSVISLILKACIYFVAYYNIAKYVFFEMFPRHSKKWNIYYLATFLVGTSLFVLFYETALAVFIIGLAIPLMANRKSKKWVILIELVPWISISEVFIDPIFTMTEYFIEDPNVLLIVTLSILGFLMLCLIGFLTVGKKWRVKFDSEISKINLAKWERVMLCVVGLILISYPIVSRLSVFETTSTDVVDVIGATFGFVSYNVFSFALGLITAIIITMTNKKAAYQSKVLNMQNNVIGMMAEIIENRDENTGGHIQRTAKYVEIIANELKEEGLYKNILTDEYINDMRVAAPLHDIGKIHVSDLILNKPGKLEPEEFEIMKTHAAEGRKLLLDAKEYLGDFNYLDIAVDMAGSHHEWWDGSPKGYPDHKKGEEIPLCARIMAVADVFDALTSKRCYRDAMALDKAYKIIREERGTHFDKTVVDAFFAANPQIEEALNGFLAE